MIISRLFLIIQDEAVGCEIRVSLSVSKVNKNGRRLLLCKKVEHRIGLCIVYLYYTGTAMQQIKHNAFGSFI